MKYSNIFMVLALFLGLSSCLRVSPIDVEVIGKKAHEDISSYKKNVHSKSLTWFDHWDTNGSKETYLSSLPDSLDIAVVNMNTVSLDIRKKKDLEYVKSQKKIILLLPINLNDVISDFGDKINDVFDQVVESHPELDEDKLEDLEEIKRIVEKEEDNIKLFFEKKIDNIFTQSIDNVKNIGFDGLDIQVKEISDPFIKNVIKSQIERVKEDGSLKLMVEGDYIEMSSVFKCIDYLVDVNEEPQNLKSMNKTYEKLKSIPYFVADKLFWYVDVNGVNWNNPFSDIISSENNPISRVYSIAKWKPNDNGQTGIAIRERPNNKYIVLRSCIQYMSHK